MEKGTTIKGAHYVSILDRFRTLLQHTWSYPCSFGQEIHVVRVSNCSSHMDTFARTYLVENEIGRIERSTKSECLAMMKCHIQDDFKKVAISGLLRLRGVEEIIMLVCRLADIISEGLLTLTAGSKLCLKESPYLSSVNCELYWVMTCNINK